MTMPGKIFIATVHSQLFAQTTVAQTAVCTDNCLYRQLLHRQLCTDSCLQYVVTTSFDRQSKMKGTVEQRDSKLMRNEPRHSQR